MCVILRLHTRLRLCVCVCDEPSGDRGAGEGPPERNAHRLASLSEVDGRT